MLSDGEGPSIVGRASHGARLLTARGAGMRALSIGANIALVALVSPADLGLLAIVRGVTGVAGTSSDLGFAWALLRRADAPSSDEYAGLAGMQFLLLAGFLAVFVAAPSLLTTIGAVPAVWRAAMLLVLATMLSVPFGTGARIRIERDLDFRRIAIADVSSVLIQNIALLGFAIARQFALGVFISTGVTLLYTNVLLWYWSPGPGPGFRFATWRRLGREFAGFSVGHVGAVLNNSVTPIVIAHLFGLTTAGLWALAVRLGNVLQLAHEGYRRAAVPAAALLSNSRAQLQRLASETLAGAVRWTAPLLGLMVAALPALGWFLPRWAPAVPLAQCYLIGFGLTGLYAAAVIPVAVALKGPRPVIIEQFAPVIAGWAALGVLALIHRSTIVWAIAPMFAVLALALWRIAAANVRPVLDRQWMAWGVALAGTIVATAFAQSLRLPGYLVAALGVGALIVSRAAALAPDWISGTPVDRSIA
ncbi:MAG TPA: oligosaccharide flippase family protein [Gemmatimonadales bacterium]